jgi:poly(hydroxyalkanoate) depolymerase family esterase
MNTHRVRLVPSVHRMLALALATALLLGLAGAPAGRADGHDDEVPRLQYWLHRPEWTAARPPLVVVLHGCSQGAKQAVVGTRWTELADRWGFVTVFPEQRPEANGMQCWNWFLPEHQHRGSGEPEAIASIVRHVVATQGIDADRVYVTGMSAGADMATVLAVAYPDLFAAVGAMAGCAYLTCTDVTGAAAHAEMGDRAQVVPAVILQGDVDTVNNVAMGETLVAQWVGTNDRADNGVADGSVSAVPTSVERHDARGARPGEIGDPCIRNRQWPCAGAVLGLERYPATVRRHTDQLGCAVVEAWTIHGLGHDFPGGDPAGTYTDPIGPSGAEVMWEFLRHHRQHAPCTMGVAAAAA